MNDMFTPSEAELVDRLEAANKAYRNGKSLLMSDAEYDALVEQLRALNPQHPFLARPEPESDWGLGKVRHNRPMLSTDKAYTHEELCRWLDKVDKAAEQVGAVNQVMIDVMPKFDGVAAQYDQGVLATRGDGFTGNDISHMIARGVVMPAMPQGAGEIVLRQDYFDQHLQDDFEFARNVVSGAVSADSIHPLVEQALADGAIEFVSFGDSPYQCVSTQYLRDNGVEEIRESLLATTGFPTDGLVLEAILPAICEHMGSTSHHHRWMLAAKTVTETDTSRVTGVTYQVGRTGRVTPVVQIEPVRLSGATITNVTAHHVGRLVAWGIGEGALVELTRAGEVIPKLLSVPEPVDSVPVPENCPCCETALDRKGDFLICPNLECADRARARLMHFFATLGTVDLFGPVTCNTLVENDVRLISQVFALSAGDYEAMGFGPGQAANLAAEIEGCADRSVDDFRVLAAMGVEHLGKGDSKKLLKVWPIESIAQLSSGDIHWVPGFGALTAGAIASELAEVADELAFVIDRLKRLERTPRAEAANTDSPIAGKNIVFTGSMTSGKRPDMEKVAEGLGAKCQSSVNAKTDYLVAGEKTGASKIEKAEKHGTTVVSEAEYLALIGA